MKLWEQFGEAGTTGYILLWLLQIPSHAATNLVA